MDCAKTELIKIALDHKLTAGDEGLMEEAYKKLLKDQTGLKHFSILVHSLEDQPVGSCLYNKKTGQVMVYVKPEHRRQKIGTQMIEQLTRQKNIHVTDLLGVGPFESGEKFFDQVGVIYYPEDEIYTFSSEETDLIMKGEMNVAKTIKARKEKYRKEWLARNKHLKGRSEAMMFYARLNMHYPLEKLKDPEIFKNGITMYLQKDKSKIVPDLDEVIVSIELDVKEEDIVKHEEHVKDPKKELGAGIHDLNYRFFYNGPIDKIGAVRVVKKAGLIDLYKIPRYTIVVPVSEDLPKDTNWWESEEVVKLIDQFKPKVGAKGYAYKLFGDANLKRLQIDYVPAVIDMDPFGEAVTEVMLFAGKMASKLENVVQDPAKNIDEVDFKVSFF